MLLKVGNDRRGESHGWINPPVVHLAPRKVWGEAALKWGHEGGLSYADVLAMVKTRPA